jgi:hypothetical protein
VGDSDFGLFTFAFDAWPPRCNLGSDVDFAIFVKKIMKMQFKMKYIICVHKTKTRSPIVCVELIFFLFRVGSVVQLFESE